MTARLFIAQINAFGYVVELKYTDVTFFLASGVTLVVPRLFISHHHSVKVSISPILLFMTKYLLN